MRGCLAVLFGAIIAFAALEGGIVLAAISLHDMLGDPPSFSDTTVGGALAGILLAFAGPCVLAASSGSSPRPGWRDALASLPDFLVAGSFVLGWAAPQTIGPQAAGMLVGIMVLEFIIIHASVMLAVLPQQFAARATDGSWWKTAAVARVGLIAIYSLFAFAISAAFSTAWLFVGFWMLLINKFIADGLSPPAERELRRQQHMARWATSAGLYLLLAMGSIFIPVPPLAAFSGAHGEGLWEEHPEQAIAMGALYFAILGFCELYGYFTKVNARSPGMDH